MIVKVWRWLRIVMFSWMYEGCRVSPMQYVCPVLWFIWTAVALWSCVILTAGILSMYNNTVCILQGIQLFVGNIRMSNIVKSCTHISIFFLWTLFVNKKFKRPACSRNILQIGSTDWFVSLEVMIIASSFKKD